MHFGIYIRSIGERTEQLCIDSCGQYIDLKDIHVLRNYFPSYNIYREMFNRAVKSEYDWFLGIDADVVLYENWFKIVHKDIEHCINKKVFKFTYLVDDYIFREPIDRGNHIYNNAFSKYALKELKKNIFISKLPRFLKKHYEIGRYLKPETSLRGRLLKTKNLLNFNYTEVIGVHGAEQYLSEVFRRFAVRANRNSEYANKYNFLHQSNQESLHQQGDIDRYVANLGWNYGMKHHFGRVDARTLEKYRKILKEIGITERNKINKDLTWFYNKYQQDYLKRRKTSK